MRSARSFFVLLFAAIPVLYCGGLLLYLNHVRGAFGGLLDKAMAPTMLGLGAFGLLFLLLFLWKLRRLAAPPAPPGTGSRAPAEEEKSDFDPDAAIARYLARRDAAASQTGFGRKGV